MNTFLFIVVAIAVAPPLIALVSYLYVPSQVEVEPLSFYSPGKRGVLNRFRLVLILGSVFIVPAFVGEVWREKNKYFKQKEIDAVEVEMREFVVQKMSESNRRVCVFSIKELLTYGFQDYKSLRFVAFVTQLFYLCVLSTISITMYHQLISYDRVLRLFCTVIPFILFVLLEFYFYLDYQDVLHAWNRLKKKKRRLLLEYSRFGKFLNILENE